MTYGFAIALAAGALVAARTTDMPPAADAAATGAIARVEAPVAGAQVVLEQEVVDGCRGCHRDNLSLAVTDPGADTDAEVEALAEAITAIMRNEANHIVPIAGLSDEDLMALAKALADPDNARAR